MKYHATGTHGTGGHAHTHTHTWAPIVNTHKCAHQYTHTDTHKRARVHRYTPSRAHIQTHTHTYTRMGTHIQTHTHTHARTRTERYTHTYTHAHTHTNTTYCKQFHSWPAYGLPPSQPIRWPKLFGVQHSSQLITEYIVDETNR